MTGFFVRFPDNQGRWRAVEVDKLTDQELINWALKLDDSQTREWLISMVRWIRVNVKQEPVKPEMIDETF